METLVISQKGYYSFFIIKNVNHGLGTRGINEKFLVC